MPAAGWFGAEVEGGMFSDIVMVMAILLSGRGMESGRSTGGLG